MNLLDQLVSEVRQAHPEFPLEPLKRAFEIADKAHVGQMRRSGEPYIVHPVEVVRILLRMHMDLPSLIAGLLHDVVEDTHLRLEDVEKEFGKEVSFIVDGVTKLSKLSFRSKHTQQAENFRKMIMAMGKDIRVILIKLADRLHNMRTLQHMTPEKQMEIALETEEIYGPLAHRLGIHWLKTELQDLSLRYLKPEVYTKLAALVAGTKTQRETYIQKTVHLLKEKLAEQGITHADVTGRPKHFYSIYKKMEDGHLAFNEIYDLLAFRVVCEDIKSCYQALGLIHTLWKPVPGRFKDYIAMPKANLYQSLHTTVIGPQGQRIEVQIRTFEMHRIAEFGIAAHWQYKEDGSVDQDAVETFSWVRKLVDEQKALEDPSEFLSTLKVDLFEEEIFVFSPKGDVIALPKGACPVDFAFAIHSGVGHRCVGAKVNGRLVPLRHRLHSGDSIEILTSEGQTPRKDWLDFVITSKAKSKIRAFVKKAQRDQSKELGQKILEREFRKHKLNYQKTIEGAENPEAVFRAASAANEEDLMIKVGYGKILANEAFEKMAPLLGVQAAPPPTPAELEEEKSSGGSRPSSGSSPVIVDGIDNLLVRFARCCKPIPGEPIVGFVARGKGISVHRADCEKALQLDPHRKFELDWDPGKKQEFHVVIRAITVDKPGMLAEITQTISNAGSNIRDTKVHMSTDAKAAITFDVMIKDLKSLRDLLKKIQGIDGVINVERLMA